MEWWHGREIRWPRPRRPCDAARMGMLDGVAARVAAGERVEFRPSGDSMVPLVRSRQRVAVAPVVPARLAVGDIVLARVAGTVYLHLVSAVDPARRRVQISNNRGRVNGWTGYDRVYGLCVEVEGSPRPGVDGKIVGFADLAVPPSADDQTKADGRMSADGPNPPS